MKTLSYGLVLLSVCGIAGCGHQPETGVEPVVRTIAISDTVTPRILYTIPGEEVRWQNLRQNPVRVGFLTVAMLDELACEKGVSTSFGKVDDFVTIPPGKSISLCFARTGDLKYNVWFDADNARGDMSPTATVRVGQKG
jgi:hypothetical protein